MFDRHEGGENAILVHLEFPSGHHEDIGEFQELVASAGVNCLALVTGKRGVPEAKYYLGKGKADEVKQAVEALCADVVIVNHDLSPSQERNLERLIECRVLSRSGLILAIFAQRARTFEGKLQVELAQLQHLSTRLIRGWTHLERQKGGIGLRGPGETQLESDRRLLRARIKSIHQRLKKVRTQRDQSRGARTKAAMATVSLVGYTNAGKSSLFNTLTGEHIYAADQLFATLDPTMRKLVLPGSVDAVLADTVGFIRHLPHDLIEAFRATLEETRDADLLLHIVDLSRPNWRDTVTAVNVVLAEIGATDLPVIYVYNKIDLLDDCEPGYNDDGELCKVWLSAKTGQGMEALRTAIVEKLYGKSIERTLCLTPSEGKLRARLFELGSVTSETIDEQGNYHLTLTLNERDEKLLLLSTNEKNS